MRTIPAFVLWGSVVCLFAGCTHMVENRVVQAFSESMKDHDLTRMKAETSSEFEEKAVKGDETFRALKMIEVPEGMPQVTKVKTIKDEKTKEVAEKRVLATVGNGKNKRKIWFRLTPDGKTGRWVVDDFYLTRDDYENNRSVGMRLAVLLSMQESLDAWKSGERDQILAVATPEFSQSLSCLTPVQLAQFSKKCTAAMPPDARVLPDERIGEETAELQLARADGGRSDGKLILKFRRDGQRWRLDDLALESNHTGDDIASARHVTAAMAAAFQFDAAYRGSDKRSLQKVCTKRFFDGSLAAANLGLVRLPQPGTGLDGFDIKLEESMATFVVPAGTEVLKISLMQQAAEQLHATPRFLVDEVTIYDLNSKQDKRLSSLFTAHSTMEIFAAAVAAHDIDTLKKNATHDFVQRVWGRVKPAHFDRLPLAGMNGAKPQIVETQFRGSLTEIQVEQGEIPMTYQLREEGGRMLVDDVLSPSPAWPESMKTTADLLIPVLKFSEGLVGWAVTHGEPQMKLVRDSSTREFSKFTWDNFDDKTDIEPSPESFVTTALAGMSLAGERGEVVLGNRHRGARFSLVKEGGEFKVDDVTLIAGPQRDQQIALKRAIRAQLAQGDAFSR